MTLNLFSFFKKKIICTRTPKYIIQFAYIYFHLQMWAKCPIPDYDLMFEKNKKLILSEIDTDGKSTKLEHSHLLLVAVSCGERRN